MNVTVVISFLLVFSTSVVIRSDHTDTSLLSDTDQALNHEIDQTLARIERRWGAPSPPSYNPAIQRRTPIISYFNAFIHSLMNTPITIKRHIFDPIISYSNAFVHSLVIAPMTIKRYIFDPTISYFIAFIQILLIIPIIIQSFYRHTRAFLRQPDIQAKMKAIGSVMCVVFMALNQQTDQDKFGNCHDQFEGLDVITYRLHRPDRTRYNLITDDIPVFKFQRTTQHRYEILSQNGTNLGQLNSIPPSWLAFLSLPIYELKTPEMKMDISLNGYMWRFVTDNRLIQAVKPRYYKPKHRRRMLRDRHILIVGRTEQPIGSVLWMGPYPTPYLICAIASDPFAEQNRLVLVSAAIVVEEAGPSWWS